VAPASGRGSQRALGNQETNRLSDPAISSPKRRAALIRRPRSVLCNIDVLHYQNHLLWKKRSRDACVWRRNGCQEGGRICEQALMCPPLSSWINGSCAVLIRHARLWRCQGTMICTCSLRCLFCQTWDTSPQSCASHPGTGHAGNMLSMASL
jgi:hypothetical protein